MVHMCVCVCFVHMCVCSVYMCMCVCACIVIMFSNYADETKKSDFTNINNNYF